MKPGPQALGVQSLNHWTTGEGPPSPLELTTLMELLLPVPSTSDSTDFKALGSKKEMLPREQNKDSYELEVETDTRSFAFK